MEKDYLRIVLDGYCNLNTRKHLDDYFRRQIIIAESEYFKPEEFIDGCLAVVEFFENDLDRQLYERQRELYLILDLDKNRNNDKSSSITNEIKDLSIHNYYVHLLSISSNRYVGDLNYDAINFIKKSVLANDKRQIDLDSELNYALKAIIEVDNSIYNLDIENLNKLKFDVPTIERLLTYENYEIVIQNNFGTFFASNIDNKIYVGIEAYRKICFKDKLNPQFPFNEFDLIPEYYTLKESNYLESSKSLLKSIYNENTQKLIFKDSEIKETKEIIDLIEVDINRGIKTKIRAKEVKVGYLNWLLNPKERFELSAFEIALRHWFLVKYKIEKFISGKEVGAKYSNLKNSKNIETAYNDIEHARRKANKVNLENVYETLNEYPLIKKVIENELDLMV